MANNVFRIATGKIKKAIRENTPSPKHYILDHETIQDQKDLDADMRRKTRAGLSSHWKMASGWHPSLNSNLAHGEGNSKTAFGPTETNVEFTKEIEVRKGRKISTQSKVFAQKICLARRKKARATKRRIGPLSVLEVQAITDST